MDLLSSASHRITDLEAKTPRQLAERRRTSSSLVDLQIPSVDEWCDQENEWPQVSARPAGFLHETMTGVPSRGKSHKFLADVEV